MLRSFSESAVSSAAFRAAARGWSKHCQPGCADVSRSRRGTGRAAGRHGRRRSHPAAGRGGPVRAVGDKQGVVQRADMAVVLPPSHHAYGVRTQKLLRSPAELLKIMVQWNQSFLSNGSCWDMIHSSADQPRGAGIQKNIGRSGPVSIIMRAEQRHKHGNPKLTRQIGPVQVQGFQAIPPQRPFFTAMVPRTADPSNIIIAPSRPVVTREREETREMFTGSDRSPGR